MDPALVEAVLAEGANAPVDDGMKAALALIEKFTLCPDELGADDIQQARQAGLTDVAIEHAFYVSTIFNIEDRLADAFDFYVPKKEALEKIAPTLLKLGYRLFA